MVFILMKNILMKIMKKKTFLVYDGLNKQDLAIKKTIGRKYCF